MLRIIWILMWPIEHLEHATLEKEANLFISHHKTRRIVLRIRNLEAIEIPIQATTKSHSYWINGKAKSKTRKTDHQLERSQPQGISREMHCWRATRSNLRCKGRSHGKVPTICKGKIHSTWIIVVDNPIAKSPQRLPPRKTEPSSPSFFSTNNYYILSTLIFVVVQIYLHPSMQELASQECFF